MLNNTNRFHGLGSLRQVNRYGKNVRGPQLSLKFAENKRRSSFRCAVIVSRKVHGSAVVRNRIRRRIYEVVRQNSNQFNGIYDLVFIASSDKLAGLPAVQLESSVLECFEQAKLLSKPAAPGRDIINREEN